MQVNFTNKTTDYSNPTKNSKLNSFFHYPKEQNQINTKEFFIKSDMKNLREKKIEI